MSMCGNVSLCTGFVYLRHVLPLLGLLCAQVHLEALAHPVKDKEIINI